MLGRCHVWSSLNNHKQEIKATFKDSLSRLGLSEFKDISKFLLDLELHENQELARQLVKGIEDFLCERENIIDIEEINEVEICTDVNVLDRQEDRHIVFRELKRVVRREDGVAGSEELYFGIKTYKKELDQFMKSVIIPFYGFEEMWIRFENSVMPFLLVNKVDKENVLRLFEENYVLIDSFLNLDENNQKFIIKKLTKKKRGLNLSASDRQKDSNKVLVSQPEEVHLRKTFNN